TTEIERVDVQGILSMVICLTVIRIKVKSRRRNICATRQSDCTRWLGNSGMRPRGWTYISSSVIGGKHRDLELPCQDACECKVLPTSDGFEVLVAVVSDGAGSSHKSQTGSAKACTDFIWAISSALTHQVSLAFLTSDYIRDWISDFKRKIKILAEQDNVELREYACTFLTAIVGSTSAVFAQLGDGGIVFAGEHQDNSYQLVFTPQEGQYANQTYFLTDKAAEENLMFQVVEGKVEELSVFSDGMQSLVLNYENQTAHLPFFRPIFEALRTLPAGRSEALQASLVEYLESETILDRTDDDKSLIFATRR